MPAPAYTPSRSFRAAISMWKWEQYLYSNIPEGKTALHINLDETSVQLWQARQRGWIALRKYRSSRKVRKKCASHATLKAQRSNITHVAIVCDRMDIQKRLPQFLLASNKVMLARDIPLVNAILPSNVFLIRSKSSWSDEEKMKLVLQKLVEVLADVVHLYQPILWLDTASCHLHSSLFDYAGRNGIFMALIPASMTWLLQVLDVKVFAIFKRFFKLRFHAKRAQSTTGILSCVEVVELLVFSIRKVLENRNWADAFAALGFAANQDSVDSFLLENLRMTRVPAIPDGKPTNAEVRCVFPKNRSPFFDELFRWVGGQPDLLALPAPVAAALALQLGPTNQPALPASSNSCNEDNGAPSGSGVPHAVAVGPKRRSRMRRTLPPSFAYLQSGASSSAQPVVDPLDQLLQDQADLYAWLGNTSHVDPP